MSDFEGMKNKNQFGDDNTSEEGVEGYWRNKNNPVEKFG